VRNDWNTPVHSEDIKAELRKGYKSLAAFEIAKNLPTGSVRDVLRGRAVARTEIAISDALDKPLHTIFPRRYAPPQAGDSSTFVDATTQNEQAHRLSRAAN
jgi:lambda repressor-like predicted transcriptional regulator